MKDKKDWKLAIKIIAVRLAGVILPIILFLIYLFKNNIVNEFLNYAIYGIKEFKNFIPYTDLFKNYGVHIKILAVIVPITILYLCYKAIIKEEKNENLVLFAYSCACIAVVYPISDDIHFYFAILPAIIGLVYILHDLFKEKVNKKIIREIFKCLIEICIISILVISIINLGIYIINCRQYKKLNHFKYILVRK